MKRKHILAWALALLLLPAMAGCSVRKNTGPAPTPAPTAVPTAAPTAAPTPKPTAAPAEEKSAYDEAAWQAAAEKVREEYAALDENDLASFDEAAHPELPWYTAAIATPVRNDLFWARYDFDGNGVPELVIAAGDETWQQPMGLYAFDGEKMVYLCKEQPLGERAYLTYFQDGLFAIRGSGGAATGICVLWRIAPDGVSTELVEIMDYEFQDADTVVYTPELGNMTPEEFTRTDYLRGFDVPLTYTRFASRLQPSEE